jgi:hypothetical protein
LSNDSHPRIRCRTSQSTTPAAAIQPAVNAACTRRRAWLDSTARRTANPAPMISSGGSNASKR